MGNKLYQHSDRKDDENAMSHIVVSLNARSQILSCNDGPNTGDVHLLLRIN